MLLCGDHLQNKSVECSNTNDSSEDLFRVGRRTLTSICLAVVDLSLRSNDFGNFLSVMVGSSEDFFALARKAKVRLGVITCAEQTFSASTPR